MTVYIHRKKFQEFAADLPELCLHLPEWDATQ